jgi:hypothetical protein
MGVKMKKYFFLFLVVGMLPLCSLNAQNNYDKSTVLQVGVGYGLLNNYGNVNIPPVSIAVDFPFQPNLTLGGYFGYSSSKDIIYRADGVIITQDMGINYSYVLFGGRLNYHFPTGIKNFDGYIGGMLGFNIVTASTFGLGPENISPHASGLLYGGQLGGRLYLTDAFAIFAEVGYGIGYIAAGCAFKL